MTNFKREFALSQKCEICGYDRYLEVCHIVPKRLGGGDKPVNKVFLCPNHHKLLDYGLLNNEEVAKLEHNILILVDCYLNNLKVQEYLYFLLGLKGNPPQWLERSRSLLKKKESNNFF